jgi:tetratricopeptide (TPR) repeat protein
MAMNPTKRNILFFLSLLLLNTEAISQNSKDQNFRIGIENYSAGNYNEALRLWTEIYITGYRSAELAYNIGNANYKLNNIPDAILFYERAYLLKPTDEDIKYNLQIARTLVIDKFEEIPELFFLRWYDLLSLLLTSNMWATTSLVTFLLFLLMLSLYLYSSRYRYKVIGFWLAVSLLFISMLTLSFSARNRSMIYNSNKAILFCPVVHGKSSPDDSGTDLFVLHEGTKVSVEDEVGDWFEIRLSDGNKGWIQSNCLQKI